MSLRATVRVSRCRDAQQVELDPAQFLALPMSSWVVMTLFLVRRIRTAPAGPWRHQDSGGVHRNAGISPVISSILENSWGTSAPTASTPRPCGRSTPTTSGRPRRVVGVFEPLHRRDVFADGFQVQVATGCLLMPVHDPGL